MSRLSLEGPRFDGRDHAGDPPQGSTDPAVLWDLVFSGEIDALKARWALGAYNLADWKYATVASPEFLPRTVPQRGRSVVASLSARF